LKKKLDKKMENSVQLQLIQKQISALTQRVEVVEGIVESLKLAKSNPVQSVSKRLELVEEVLASTKQVNLSLGPIALAKPLPREFSLENLVSFAHNLGISEKWTQNWYAKQDVLGWKDSYGNPIRNRCHYLRYCWINETERRPDRPRQGDLTLGGYADYSKDGKGKPPKILPIPREATEEDFKLAGEEAKKLVEGLRRQLEKS
jgi:hypothetical protein